MVVMDSQHYVQICLDLLNITWYKPISFSLIDVFMVDFYSLVDEAYYGNIITKIL